VFPRSAGCPRRPRSAHGREISTDGLPVTSGLSPKALFPVDDCPQGLPDGIVPIAEPIPLWRVGLCWACHIRRTRGNHRGTRLLKASDTLPSLPAMSPGSPIKRAFCHGPSPILTSTRAIGAAPDHATPRIGSPPGSTSVSGSGSVIRLRTRCSDTGSLISCPPRCHS